jgi:ribosomal protein L37AE/L43A
MLYVASTCPVCGEAVVEIRRMPAGTWLVRCCNGDCPQKPEVLAQTKEYAVKAFEALPEKKGLT